MSSSDSIGQIHIIGKNSMTGHRIRVLDQGNKIQSIFRIKRKKLEALGDLETLQVLIYTNYEKGVSVFE